MKPTVDISVNLSAWECACCGASTSQYVSLNINNDIDINFLYNNAIGDKSFRGNNYSLYLSILDFLGYAIIAKGKTIYPNAVNVDSENKIITNYYPIEHIINVSEDIYLNYEMHEALLREKHMFDNLPVGDNNIVIEVLYKYDADKISKGKKSFNDYVPIKAVISFPDKTITELRNDNIEWNGDYDVLFKTALEKVAHIQENYIYHEEHSNIFLEDMFRTRLD